MLEGRKLVASQICVCFGRVMKRLQVIADRNDREKQQNQHNHGDKRQATLRFVSLLEPDPEARNADCHQRPGRVKEKLHSQSRFYTREGCGPAEEKFWRIAGMAHIRGRLGRIEITN